MSPLHYIFWHLLLSLSLAGWASSGLGSFPLTETVPGQGNFGSARSQESEEDRPYYFDFFKKVNYFYLSLCYGYMWRSEDSLRKSLVELWWSDS